MTKESRFLAGEVTLYILTNALCFIKPLDNFSGKAFSVNFKLGCQNLRKRAVFWDIKKLLKETARFDFAIASLRTP